MNRTIQPFVYVVLAWLMAATLAGCALAPPREVPAQTGRVLDEETRLPIEGAIVVFRWQGTGTKAFVDTQTVCYHVESAVTDAEGRYVTAPWKEESRYRDLSMKRVLDTAYKAGYVHTRTDRAAGVHYLKLEIKSDGENFEYAKRVSSASGCPAAGESEINLLPLRRALLEQAKLHAETVSDNEEIEGFLFQVETLELGYEEAERRQVERLRRR